jgi:hypothetical protein
MYARRLMMRLNALARLDKGAATLLLAALAVVLALTAIVTQVPTQLDLPLFVGGLGVGVLGVRAIFQRWDLIERLAMEPGAYVIPEVLDYASREATMERRQTFAALLRRELRPPYRGADTRVTAMSDELEALARDLEDPAASLDPVAAVRCMRMLSDPIASPLFNPALPPDDLRSHIRLIRTGFHRNSAHARS